VWGNVGKCWDVLGSVGECWRECESVRSVCWRMWRSECGGAGVVELGLLELIRVHTLILFPPQLRHLPLE
jgi:hypothetical protein